MTDRPGDGDLDTPPRRDEPSPTRTAADAVLGLVASVQSGVGGRREWAERLARVARDLAGAARQAGVRGVASGRVLAETLTDAAPRLPIRTRPALLADFPGRSDEELAEELTRVAARSTAAIGAAAGALSAVEFTAPPTLLAAPVQLAAETLAVAAIEVKLLAELHELYAAEVPAGSSDRAAAYLLAWARQRAIGPAGFGVGGLRGAISRELKLRLIRRMGRNLTTLAPFLAGAVAGAEVNRRATRSLAGRITADLRSRRPAPSG